MLAETTWTLWFAMGWVELSLRDIRWSLPEDGEDARRLRWANPDNVAFECVPDFYRDPVAVTALWEWLTDQGFDCDVANEVMNVPEERYSCEITHRKHPGFCKTRDASSWTAALANAADAAIKEASGVKD